MTINWLIKEFNDLTSYELYSVIKLRLKVFSIEQNCIYQDIDGKDIHAYHVMGYHNDKLIAYTRLIKPGICYDMCSIGRVVVEPEYRKYGIGKKLMQVSIDGCIDKYNTQSIKIGAQFYLKRFYESFGFQAIGDKYIEDNIEHIEMIKDETNTN